MLPQYKQAKKGELYIQYEDEDGNPREGKLRKVKEDTPPPPDSPPYQFNPKAYGIHTSTPATTTTTATPSTPQPDHPPLSEEEEPSPQPKRKKSNPYVLQEAEEEGKEGLEESEDEGEDLKEGEQEIMDEFIDMDAGDYFGPMPYDHGDRGMLSRLEAMDIEGTEEEEEAPVTKTYPTVKMPKTTHKMGISHIRIIWKNKEDIPTISHHWEEGT